MTPEEKRAEARALIDQTPDAGLGEAVATLTRVRDFWSEPIQPAAPPVTRWGQGVVISVETRPDLVLPIGEVD